MISRGRVLSVAIRYHSKVRIAAVSALLLCSACAIGPNYQRPDEVAPPEQYRNVLTEQDAHSFADLNWIDLYQDPDLQALIRQALANNLDLQNAVARVEEFRGQHKVQRSYLGPDIRATASTSPSTQGSEDASYAAGFSLSWELDLFGKLRRANESARAQLLASEDNARAVMSELVAAVATTWFQLRELDEEVVIIDRTISSQQASLELVRSLMRNGVASGTEEQQAISQLATTRAQRPLAVQQRLETENFLLYLVGSAPGILSRGSERTAMPVPPEIPVGLPAQLLSRRPDLRVLENTLHAATAQIGVAEASRFPYLSIGLTSFLGLISPELQSLIDNKDPTVDVFAIGPTLDMPIFQSGRGNGNVETARAVARQALLAYRSGVLVALREVSNSLSSTEQVRELIAQNEIRNSAARETLRLQQMRYRSGVVSYIEVLDAERQLFAAEIDLAQSQLKQLTSYIELYRALGGGWSEEEIQQMLSMNK